MIYHNFIKNRVKTCNALAQTFGTVLTGPTMMLCGYDIADILQGIEAALNGDSIEIVQKHKVQYFSSELVQFAPQVNEEDDFYFGDDIESYGTFPDECDSGDELEAEGVTQEELQSLQDDEDEDNEETRKFKEIEKIMFSGMKF